MKPHFLLTTLPKSHPESPGRAGLAANKTKLLTVPLAVIGGVLMSGCSTQPTSSPPHTAPSGHSAFKQPTTPCQSRGTVYLFPDGSGASESGNADWAALTSAVRHHGKLASIETVIPGTVWRVVRLIVPSSNADAATHVAEGISSSATPSVSAQACFTGWDTARLSRIAKVSQSTWLAAEKVAHGMDFFGPQVVQPGQKIYVVVVQGSFDGDILRQGMKYNVFYAESMDTNKRQFPVTLVNTAGAGAQILGEFVIPANAPSGTYRLALPGGNLYVGDFVFEVR